jgi:hypothetical protein
MPAPRHIIDSLECVLSIFFSNVRHNLRAAFILSDELIESICRVRGKQLDKKKFPKFINFYDLLGHKAVGLDPKTPGLGESVFHSHETRNNMQHENPAATVDSQHCADAIIDAAKVIEHCFPGALAAMPDQVRVALRVTKLLATGGDFIHRSSFAGAMQQQDWRIDPAARPKAPKPHEIIVTPGDRDNWGIIMFREHAKVDALLNGVKAPPIPPL